MVSRYCNHLFEELYSAINELSSEGLGNCLKIVALHSKLPVSKDVAVTDAIEK